jgi:hypothetical protein
MVIEQVLINEMGQLRSGATKRSVEQALLKVRGEGRASEQAASGQRGPISTDSVRHPPAEAIAEGAGSAGTTEGIGAQTVGELGGEAFMRAGTLHGRDPCRASSTHDASSSPGKTGLTLAFDSCRRPWGRSVEIPVLTRLSYRPQVPGDRDDRTNQNSAGIGGRRLVRRRECAQSVKQTNDPGTPPSMSAGDAERCDALIAIFQNATVTKAYGVQPLPAAPLKIYAQKLSMLDDWDAYAEVVSKSRQIANDMGDRGPAAIQAYYAEAKACIQRVE